MENFKCAYTRAVPLAELKPHPGNRNAHPEKQIAALAKIIAQNGQRSPIIVSNLSGYVVKGHGRLLALERLGWPTGAVDFQDYSSELEEYRDRIADNEIARYAEFDAKGFIDDVKELGFELEEMDFEEFGLIDFDYEVEEPVKGDPDDMPDNAPSLVKPGDIWVLGRHRLLCGDATSIADVEKAMGGLKADLLLTDPPYNVDYVGKTKEALKIKNDKMDNKQFFQFLLDFYTAAHAVMCDGAAAYIFHADSEGHNFRQAMLDAGFKLSQCCVWVKDCMVMGRNDYHWAHEPILYGWKPTGSHKWHSDRKQTTVWNFDRPKRSEQHPTMKPVALLEYPIKNSTQSQNSIVLDPFAGSGSTMIACEQTGRKCISIELDPKYCDKIIKRYENATGKVAILENDPCASLLM